MTERLTKREGKHTVRIGNEWRRRDPVWDKLAHYEDLEEQGRLHIVPKGFWEAIVTYLVNDRCPYDFRLKGFNEEDCKVDDGRCRLCWGMALEAGEEE